VDPETGAIQTVYLPGDSCLAVLRDLKRLWRKDDTDDERTVFRCFHRCHLARELVALIEECVGRGDHERKIALAATDLLAALTWPIDVAQELKELAEDDADIVTDYASLLRAQVEYKALLLKSNTLLRVMQLVIPCLARVSAGSNSSKFGILDRQGIEKDKRIVSLMLHLARNLLAIRDPIANGQETGEKQELATLQVSPFGQTAWNLHSNYTSSFGSQPLWYSSTSTNISISSSPSHRMPVRRCTTISTFLCLIAGFLLCGERIRPNWRKISNV
jgi:replication fork protection complex subunit Tof1/Swi1